MRPGMSGWKEKPMRLRLIAVSLASFVGSLTQGQDLTLVREDQSSFAIVIAASASPSEQRGARELQTYLKQMSGAALPIVTDAQPLGEHAILVGRSRHTDALRANVDLKSLGAEGFVLQSRGGHLLILGCGVRGTMYGCTSFLEKLGVRWLTPKMTIVPHRPTIDLPNLDERQVPDFEYRAPYIAEAFDKDWAARLKINGQQAQLDDSTGGKIIYDHFVHTFDDLIPPSEFTAHPEYFPLINGRRKSGYVQRCLSNPDVLKLAIQNVRKWIEKDPQALIYSVSQNDTFNVCQCDNCKAIEARYGGKHSGLYLWFVNQVADAIGKDHPDKLIDTLAYQFTEEPPVGIVPARNVRVRLCPIAACEAHPYLECSDPATIAFVRNLKAWSAITDTLYIWHYNTDFGNFLMPFPDFAQFPPSIALYKQSGVKGIFFEGDAAPGSSDAELRAYVMAHLVWDHRQDPTTLIDEWLHGVYRAAYPPMRRWFDLLQLQVKRPDKHLRIFASPRNYFLTPEVLAGGDRLFDEAEKLSGDDASACWYIAKSRLCLRYVELVRKPDAKSLDSFLADLPKYGITQLREGQPVAAWEKAFRARIK
jgi:hypothetical protein